jgi:uncharacterized membrane protein
MNKLFHRMFNIGVWTKGIDGVLEIAGGILTIEVKKSAVMKILLLLTQQELIEDPHDRVAVFLQHAAAHLTPDAKLFGGIYLIAHGAVKVFLSVELLRNKLWSYPAASIVLCLFIAYQIYRIALHHSVLLFLLTCLDIIIVLLIQREYRVARRGKS